MKHSKNQQAINQSLSWWYIDDTHDYRELLKMEKASLTAVKADGTLIKEDVAIEQIGGTAFAVTKNGEEHVLMPSHWVTPGCRHIENFWLVRGEDNQIVPVKDYEEADLPDDLKIYGRSNGFEGRIVHSEIVSIVPLKNGKYIVTDLDGRPYTVFKEEDEVRARVAMNNMRLG